MAETIKEASLSNPTAATETTLYQVPASTVAVIGCIFISNRNGSSRTIKVKKTDSSNTRLAQIIPDFTLSANNALRIPGPFNLTNQQKIRVEFSGSDVDAEAAILEVA